MRTCCSSSRSIRAASRRSGSAPSSGGSRRSISSDTNSCLPSAPPVIQAHEAALQAEFDAAAAQTRAALAGEPTDFMQQFGMQHLALDQMVVCPSAAFFNGIGLSPATISHHMSSLVSAGFIHVDKQNPRSFNLEAARALFWRKKSRKQVTGLSAGDSLSI